jgi:hypothetical protein
MIINFTAFSETGGYIRTHHLLTDSGTKRWATLAVADKELGWVAL